MLNYEQRMKKEQERLLNSASKVEVNTDLRNFERAIENQLKREKLSLVFASDCKNSEQSYDKLLQAQMQENDSSI